MKSICDKCGDKIQCAMKDTKGVSDYFLKHKDDCVLEWMIDISENKLTLFIVSDKTPEGKKILTKETMWFKNIKKDKKHVILSKALPYVSLRCIKYLGLKKIREVTKNGIH